jgi:hypothetical protein
VTRARAAARRRWPVLRRGYPASVVARVVRETCQTTRVADD